MNRGKGAKGGEYNVSNSVETEFFQSTERLVSGAGQDYTFKMTDANRIQYYVMCISAFSNKKGLKERDAFNYLYKFKGIEFLVDCYEAEHTLSLEDAVDDLTRVCRNNGGNIE